jgi:hypothetical protein
VRARTPAEEVKRVRPKLPSSRAGRCLGVPTPSRAA